jgi:UDP-2-acetamido-3-amino-2,3-dideoxy-glucuronate N-acetyltransferase
MGFFVHERAWCESITVGEGTRIWAFSHVMKGAVIGTGCNVGEHCFIENEVVIGNDVTVKNGISVWDGIVIGDKVFLGPHMVFTNDLRPRSKAHDYVQLKTVVKEGATVGANATIIGGIEIGKYSMTGAGSVVTKSVPDHALVFGNPARLRGWVCSCGKDLVFSGTEAVCVCGKKYSKKDENTIIQK